MLAKLIRLDRANGDRASDVALVYEGLGDYDNAFGWLDKAIAEHAVHLDIMWAPLYDHLRADPRFERIRQRLSGSGIAQ